MHDKTREPTYFEFNNPETRKRLEFWLSITKTKIDLGENLSAKDLQKISELLGILIKKSMYKIPRKVGEKKSIPESYEQLICWYRIHLENRKGMTPTESKKEAANVFSISEKSIESYSTKHKKNLEKVIQEKGCDEVESGFKYMISRLNYKKRCRLDVS